VEITSIQTDRRPFVWLNDVEGLTLSNLKLFPRYDVSALRVRDTSNFRVSMSPGLPDMSLDRVSDGRFP